MKVIKSFLVIVLSVVGFAVASFAQSEIPDVSALKKQIDEGTELPLVAQKLHQVVDIYASDNHHDELYEYLRSLEKKNIFKKSPLLYYYKALSRFNQVQFLEESKKWEELFNNKNRFYADMGQALEKIGKMSGGDYEILLKAKLLEYKIAKKKEEGLSAIAAALLRLAQEFAGTPGYRPALIKDIANELLREGETSYAKKLYTLYVATIAQSAINHDELKKMAGDFLNEGNVDIAVSLFAAYMDKLIDAHQGKDLIMSEAFAIIDIFANTGWREGKDPFFAEELFAKIEAVYTSDAFEGKNQYKRAYNLEKMKEYEACVTQYLKLVNEFGDYHEKDRIYFRLGIINAYALRNIDEARTFLSKVVTDFKESEDYCNSAYHLGLLYQWEGKKEDALAYYRLILEKMKDVGEKKEIVRLAGERMRELEENQDLEYNIRLFLNAAVGPKINIPSLQLDIFAKHAKEYTDTPITFQVNTYLSSTGCLQQSYTYLWAGELGMNQHPFNDDKLETSYEEAGAKVLTVALVDPTGVVNGAFEIADVYPPSSLPVATAAQASSEKHVLPPSKNAQGMDTK